MKPPVLAASPPACIASLTMPSSDYPPASAAGVGTSSPRRRLARLAAVAAAAGLMLGLAAQLVSAGAAVFVNAQWWLFHADAIHWFDWLSVVMIVAAFLGGMSRRLKILSIAVIALVLAQYVTAGLRESASLGAGAALHPLTGFALLWSVVECLRQAWAERRG